MFEVIGMSISRPVFGVLMICATILPLTDGGDVDFNCNPVNAHVEDRINGSVSTDRKTYVNVSFVINSASVSDSGDYTVRVTARDTSEVTGTISPIPSVTTATTHTTITMVVSASATVHTRKYEGACGSFEGFTQDLGYFVCDGQGVKCGALGLNEEERTCM